MTYSKIFITIKNNTNKQMATNVFRADHYVWEKGSRPNTKLHERVICAHTEIAELSQMTSPTTSSYQLGLTICDGNYLELKINHALKSADVNDVTAASAQEMCEVSGSVSNYRVERSISGVEPWLLNISIFEANGDANSQYGQQEVVSQKPTRTQSTTEQEILHQNPTDTQLIQQEIFDQNPTDTQIIHQVGFDQNPTDSQLIQQEIFDQNPTDTQIIHQVGFDKNPTDSQLIQQEIFDQNPTGTQIIHQEGFEQMPTDPQLIQQEILGQGLNDDHRFVEEDIFSDIGKCTEMFIKREIIEICLAYAPTLIHYESIDQVSENTQQTTL